MSLGGSLFLFFLFCFFMAVILPSLIISLVRREQLCEHEEDSENGVINFIVSIVMYGIFTLIFFIFVRWNKDYVFGAILGEAVAYTTYTVLYVLTLLFVSKIFSIYIKPRVRVFCTELYVFVFIGSSLLMYDVGKGKNGFIYQKVKIYTEKKNNPRTNIPKQQKKPVLRQIEPIQKRKGNFDKGLNNSNTSSNKKPSECVFKSVMTDADYLACGINPPTMKYKKLDKSMNIKDLNKPYN